MASTYPLANLLFLEQIPQCIVEICVVNIVTKEYCGGRYYLGRRSKLPFQVPESVPLKMIERILKRCLFRLPLLYFADVTSLNVLELNLVVFDFASSNALYYCNN